MFEKIIKIEKVGIKDAYDLEICVKYDFDSKTNFVANGIVCKNSGGDARTNFGVLDTLSEFEQGKEFYKKYKEPCDIAIKLESKFRNCGQHAAGQVICSMPLDEIVPLRRINDVICVEWEKEPIEELGLIKFDILGLKTLTVIKETLEKIGNGVKLPEEFEDPKVYETIFKPGKTLAIFQFDTSGLQKLSKQLSIDSFKLIYAANALYRPGSLHSGQSASYILRRHGKVQWDYDHPLLEAITKDTYGQILFQEQVMKIMHDLGGFSWATAEMSRKIMTKSKGKKEFEKMREEFVFNADKKYGLSPEESGKIFDVVSTYGSYGFNQIHSIEYSVLSYYTAWLKTYYPAEFFATILSHESDGNQIKNYINDMEFFGISVNLPDINHSKMGFYTKDKRIYSGFDSIKGIGAKVAKRIIDSQPYTNLEDFLKRAKPSSSLLKSLTISGCFDCWKLNIKYIYENAELIAKKKIYQEPLLMIEEYTEKELAMLRSKYISVEVGKPLIDFYDDPFADKIKYEKIGDLQFEDYINERWVKGIVTFINFKSEGTEGAWQYLKDTLERRYAHLNFNDGTGNVLVHLSPEQYTYYKRILERGTGFPAIVKAHSIIDYQKLYCDALIVLDDIDYSNPVIKYINGETQSVINEISKEFPGYECGMIETVSYKVSKNKNPYARIKFSNEEKTLMCFRLTPDIFVSGEVVVYKKEDPFVQIIKRVK